MEYRGSLVGEFRSAKDAERYAVPFDQWRDYKAAHPAVQGVSIDSLRKEQYTHTMYVGGRDYFLVLWRGSVCDLQADAILNAANNSLLGGGGVDGAIHDAAGPLLYRECAERFQPTETSGTVITKGYNLPAHYVIHTVGPVYSSEKSTAQKLALCYKRTFDLCETHQLQSVGLCCVSCGVYGYPPEEAAYIALNSAKWRCLAGPENPRVIVFVTFTTRETKAYQRAFPEIFNSHDQPPAVVVENIEERKVEPRSIAPESSYYDKLKSEILSKPFETEEDQRWFSVPAKQWTEFKRRERICPEHIAIYEAPVLFRSCYCYEKFVDFWLVRCDIAKIKVTAIVNAANETLLGGGGIDECVHNGAGYLLLRECATLQPISVGEAVLTKGYLLPADYVIHTVAPLYVSHKETAAEDLARCYKSVLALCDTVRAVSVGLSPIGCGFYGYPVSEACGIAMQEILTHLKETDTALRRFVFAVFSEAEVEAYKALLANLAP